MRILIINSEYPPVGGGAGNASEHLARKLVEFGQDVAVLTTQFGQLPVDSYENGVRVRRIRAIRGNQFRSGAAEQSIFMLVGSIGAYAMIQEWRPDVILAFFGVPSGAIAWFTKWKTRLPYVVSLRGGDVPGFRPYDFAVYHHLISPLLRSVWLKAGAVVANSHGLGRMAERFQSQVKIDVIPNGVDIQRFTIPANRDWETPRLLFVGRLVYQKGLDILVEALGGLQSVPWKLTLVGEGPHRPSLEKFASELGITERIEFSGWLSGDELVQKYYDANIFVFPSRHEGMPNALLEAMACGLPIIATDIAGNEELVIQEKTGLLVPSEDPGALQRGLQSLLTDPGRKRTMGLASRKLVEEKYTWDQAAAQYLSLLQEILG